MIVRSCGARSQITLKSGWNRPRLIRTESKYRIRPSSPFATRSRILRPAPAACGAGPGRKVGAGVRPEVPVADHADTKRAARGRALSHGAAPRSRCTVRPVVAKRFFDRRITAPVRRLLDDWLPPVVREW